MQILNIAGVNILTDPVEASIFVFTSIGQILFPEYSSAIEEPDKNKIQQQTITQYKILFMSMPPFGCTGNVIDC
jgi:hypothetical protein